MNAGKGSWSSASIGVHRRFPFSAVASLIVCAACVALVVGPWLRPDLLWRDVADAPNHLVRIYVIDAALGRGEWYPRWLSDLYLGYGYPLLNYYAPATCATLKPSTGLPLSAVTGT